MPTNHVLHVEQRATDPIHDLGWALSTLARAHVTQVQAVAVDLPGGPRGYRVLSIAAAGSCENQAEIAERLGIARTAMTYLIDGLEAADLVRRVPAPGDRRAHRLTLTETGATRLATIREDVARVERRFLAGLSDDDAAHLRRTVELAAQHAEAPHGDPDPHVEVAASATPETLDRV